MLLATIGLMDDADIDVIEAGSAEEALELIAAEIPALVLASAAVLQSGAILATPAPGKTIGQTWLESMAD